MARAHIDQVIFGGALVAVAASWGWCGWRTANDARAQALQPVKVAAADYAPSGRDAPESRTEAWPAPKAQGGEWIYDVFTPPEIYYDPRTKEFSITPPEVAPPRAAPAAVPFGLELLAVRQPLFRLQLVGFVGEEGGYRGLFQNTATTETFLAAGGRRLPELGLTIVSFEVRMAEVPLPESMTTRRRVATAVVRDDATGDTVALTDGAPHYTTAPIATVAAGADRTKAREVRAGETIELGGSRYKIEKIQLAPPTVDATKESADPLNSERRTLTPSQPAAGESRDRPAQ